MDGLPVALVATGPDVRVGAAAGCAAETAWATLLVAACDMRAAIAAPLAAAIAGAFATEVDGGLEARGDIV